MSAKVLPHPALLKRGFESSGIHPALSAWIAAAVPPDSDVRNGLRQLRARSRDAAQNDDHMRLFLRMVESNVIGRQGVSVQPNPHRPSGREDAAARQMIEAAYAEQSQRGHWDVTGQHSRAGFARLAVRTIAQDGEALIRIHDTGPTADTPTGFAVELIDAECLDLDYNTTLANGNQVRMGVEVSPRRRPVAYHLFTDDPLPGQGYRTGRERIRVPVSEILHVYLPEWVQTSRGVPWAATALRRLKMLGGYEEAAITAARAAAVKSAVYVWQEGADPAHRPGTEEDGQLVQDLSPGGVEIAPYGYDLKTLDWAWPNTEHGQFVKDALRGIAAGLCVSYNALANDLENVNFSSLRQGALAERDLWMLLQDWWVDWVERPIYHRWLDYQLRNLLLTQRNGAPFPDDRRPGLYRVAFQGRRWPWVDPLKDMQAAREAVALGTRSISDIIRESGRDPDDVWTELGRDLERLRGLGLNLNDVLAAPPAAAEEPTDDE